MKRKNEELISFLENLANGDSVVSVAVGISDGKGAMVRSDSKISMGNIALVHEFGSVTAHIPPRSFLRVPLRYARVRKAVARAAKMVFLGKWSRGDGNKYAGEVAVDQINRAFDSEGFGRWAPLKTDVRKYYPFTKRDEGMHPLVDTGVLRSLIGWRGLDG